MLLAASHWPQLRLHSRLAPQIVAAESPSHEIASSLARSWRRETRPQPIRDSSSLTYRRLTQLPWVLYKLGAYFPVINFNFDIWGTSQDQRAIRNLPGNTRIVSAPNCQLSP